MTSPYQQAPSPTTFHTHVTVCVAVPLTKSLSRHAHLAGTVVSPALRLHYFTTYYLWVFVGDQRCAISCLVWPSSSGARVIYQCSIVARLAFPNTPLLVSHESLVLFDASISL